MRKICLSALTVAAFSTAASAVINPFTENFTASNSGWMNFNNSAPLTYAPAGGPDTSSFASGTFNFVSQAANATPVVTRSDATASGGAFAGNWIAGGVSQLSVWVRHNAPVPLTYFGRIAVDPAPGAVAVAFAPVMPNAWTQLTFAINPASPQFISFEFGDFNSVFSNVGRVQFGVMVPQSLAGVDQGYTFDFDQVAIVPAPASLALLGVGAVIGRRRRAR
jgi:hypothetical protein